jgi:hypothetical protein
VGLTKPIVSVAAGVAGHRWPPLAQTTAEGSSANSTKLSLYKEICFYA